MAITLTPAPAGAACRAVSGLALPSGIARAFADVATA
jgi:hypothetical protein